MSSPEIKPQADSLQAAENYRAPSSPLFSAERVGQHETSLEHLQPTEHDQESEDRSSKGPNLILIYSLVAFALVAAIGLAILIVLPFYRRN
jgi:hypothetical protein